MRRRRHKDVEPSDFSAKGYPCTPSMILPPGIDGYGDYIWLRPTTHDVIRQDADDLPCMIRGYLVCTVPGTVHPSVGCEGDYQVMF